MPTNINELRAECVRKNMTLEKLAEYIGINYVTLYRKMTGKTEFLRSELQSIKDILLLSDQQLLTIFFDSSLQKCKNDNKRR